MSLTLKTTTDLTPLGATLLYYPQAFAFWNDDMYFTTMSASGNQSTVIRKVDIYGRVSLVAGSGALGHVNGSGASAQFNVIGGMAFDSTGVMWVCDYLNNCIRKVTQAGDVTDFVGPVAPGTTAGHVNSATPSAVRFTGPYSIAFDAAGDAYVSDSNSNCIRKVTSAGVTTDFVGIAATATTSGHTNGTGTAARFYTPAGLAFDSTYENLYICDMSNNCIRATTVPGGVVTDFAGVAASGTTSGHIDGMGTTARFTQPQTIVKHPGLGYYYIADNGNHCIRRVTTSGSVTTFVGTSGMTPGYADGYGTRARFNGPYHVSMSKQKVLIVSDMQNSAIRKVYVEGGNRAVTTWFGSAFIDPSYADVPDSLPTSLILDVE